MTRPFIGPMRDVLTLEAPQDVPDGLGGVTRSFVARATIHAQVRVLGSSARSKAGQPQVVARLAVLMRQRADLTTDMRLRRGERLYRIVGIERMDRLSFFVRVTCEEIMP